MLPDFMLRILEQTITPATVLPMIRARYTPEMATQFADYLVRERPDDLPFAVQVVGEVLDALEAARDHAAGFSSRDGA